MSKPTPARYRMKNLSSYNASLRKRESLLTWVDMDMTWRAASLLHFLSRLRGGSSKAPKAPGAKMGATMRLRKSHLATACAAAGLCFPF